MSLPGSSNQPPLPRPSVQLGFKSSQRMIEPKGREVDWANREKLDPDRVYDRVGSSKYNVIEITLRRKVMEWWNNGAALDCESEDVRKWIGACWDRARRDASARTAAIRSAFKGKGVASRS